MSVYKVVVLGPSPEEFASCFAGESAACIYRPGVPTTPKEYCGPLCAFSNFYHARNFVFTDLDDRGGVFIFEAEWSPSTQQEIWDGHVRRLLEYLPEGTVLCQQLTLTKQVWPA